MDDGAPPVWSESYGGAFSVPVGVAVLASRSRQPTWQRNSNPWHMLVDGTHLAPRLTSDLLNTLVPVPLVLVICGFTVILSLLLRQSLKS